MKNIPKDLFEYYNAVKVLDHQNIEIDSDGLLIYTWDIDFENSIIEEVPIGFRHFKSIKGSLDFTECKNLKNVDNLINLKEVGYYIDFSNCESLENLNGLRNLKYCDKIFLGGLKNIPQFEYITDSKALQDLLLVETIENALKDI